MPKYTTGDIAKRCGVTVRTVQYYDARDLLPPSELSEGGRRLYSEEDLRRMKVICFLRELGLPINSISQLLSVNEPSGVISLILEQQEKILRQEIQERQTRLDMLGQLQRELSMIDDLSVESIGDIVYRVENRKKLRKLYGTILAMGIPMEIVEIASILLWVSKGSWWPFALWQCVEILFGLWSIRFYLKRVAYICPVCHKIFIPRFWEAFLAPHTPSTRKLTCAQCGHHGFCMETYGTQEG